MRRLLLVGACTAAMAGLGFVCCSTPSPGPDPGTGTAPQLPPPTRAIVPTVSVADAVGWPSGAVPSAPQGLAVKAFAAGLDHPRWVYVLPNGDVLVAETNAPPKPDD